MKMKAKSVFVLMLLASLTSGFADYAEHVSARTSEKVMTKTVSVKSDTSPVDENGTGDEDEKTGNFLKDLKQSIENLNKKNAETKLVTGSMELTMQCGFENMVKYGRNICIQSDITNNGNDFVGYMQIVIPSTENENNVMYQKEISVPAGETKKIMFPLSPDTVGSRYNVRIVDEQGKEVVTKDLMPNFQYDMEKLFVGVLTDEKDYLGYLSQTDVKVFYLDKDKLPDEENSLDTLDMIVINNFNTGNLSEEQYKALKTWVNNGGCLVIGTGTTGSKTLDIFKDDFITGTFGEVDSDGTMSLELDNSKEVSVKKANRIFYNIEKGIGNVIICNQDLGVQYNDWSTTGKSLIKAMKNNLSSYKKTQLDQNTDSSYYEILDGLNLVSMGNLELPSIGKYALILIIYIVLTGPFLYLILKKIDKRHLLWGMVPASAIAFGIGIYALGSETRLDDPVVGYMNFYTLDGSGKDQGEESIFFNITVPTNDKYTFELPETTKISCLNNNYDNGYSTNPQNNSKDKWSYRTAINYGAEGTTVQLKDYSTFSNAYFKSISSHVGNGTYKYNLKAYGYQLSGTFTNNLGYDLEKAMIVCDQRLFSLGDIKNGESIDLGSIEEDKIYNISTADAIYDEDIISELAGGNVYSNSVEPGVQKRYSALQYMFNYNYTEFLQNTKLIAFTEEEAGDGFVQQLDLECNGLKVVEIPLDVDRTNGKKEFIANLDKYAKIIEGDFDPQYRYSFTEEALQEVQFGENDVIKSIGYDKEVNSELMSHKSSSYGFDGKVYFYNVNKGDYDLVIESGKEAKVTNLAPYLDEDNKLLIKYKFKNGNGNITFPVLSAVKEAK